MNMPSIDYSGNLFRTRSAGGGVRSWRSSRLRPSPPLALWPYPSLALRALITRIASQLPTRRGPNRYGAVLLAALLAVAGGCATNSPQAELVYFPAPPGKPRVVHLKSFNSLHDLVLPRVRLVGLIRGGAVSPYVGTPAGIAYRGGHLYICDTDINAVHDWDLATGRARRIGASGKTVLVKPVAVAVDDAGTIYVADTGRGEVVAFDSKGAVVRRFKPPEREEYRPVACATGSLSASARADELPVAPMSVAPERMSAVARDVRGSKLYVADIAAHKIDVYSTEGGDHLGAFGEVGSEPGDFYYPMGVAANAGGDILVSDMMNARVQIFDAKQQYRSSFGRPGDRYGDMGKPRHLAVGLDGAIFIADAEFAHVHLFNAQGRLLMLIGGPEDKPGATPLPRGVAVARNVPGGLASWVPADFEAKYFLFVSNSVGSRRISLFAVGVGR